ncbi:MAG: uroporphyrinogen-III synthase [Betaproteobacteria bacterium]|nr:uroporphyrinogen-III synthase [Betaproteobacteria bacterium]
MRIALTQPQPRCAVLADSLRARGHEVLELPVRRLTAVAAEPPAARALAASREADWLIFVSPGAVEAALPVLLAQPGGWLPRAGLAMIGPGTAAALHDRGINPDALPIAWRLPDQPPFDAGALIAQPPFDQPAGLRILVLRGERGREDWIDTLRARGAQVSPVAVHQATVLRPPPTLLARAADWLVRPVGPHPAVFVFTARDAIDALGDALPETGRASALALTVHPRLAEALQRRRWARARLIEPGESGLLAALESAAREGIDAGSSVRPS